MSAERYIRELKVLFLTTPADGAEAVLGVTLPGILARHRADVLREAAGDCLCLADHDMFKALAAKAVEQ